MSNFLLRSYFLNLLSLFIIGRRNLVEKKTELTLTTNNQNEQRMISCLGCFSFNTAAFFAFQSETLASSSVSTFITVTKNSSSRNDQIAHIFLRTFIWRVKKLMRDWLQSQLIRNSDLVSSSWALILKKKYSASSINRWMLNGSFQVSTATNDTKILLNTASRSPL